MIHHKMQHIFFQLKLIFIQFFCIFTRYLQDLYPDLSFLIQFFQKIFIFNHNCIQDQQFVPSFKLSQYRCLKYHSLIHIIFAAFLTISQKESMRPQLSQKYLFHAFLFHLRRFIILPLGLHQILFTSLQAVLSKISNQSLIQTR